MPYGFRWVPHIHPGIHVQCLRAGLGGACALSERGFGCDRGALLVATRKLADDAAAQWPVLPATWRPTQRAWSRACHWQALSYAHCQRRGPR
jgi:hypothetical protein